MIVTSDEDDSESSDDGMLFTGKGDTCKTRIFTVKAWTFLVKIFAGIEIEDLIVDTGSGVSFASSQFYETISNRGQL